MLDVGFGSAVITPPTPVQLAGFIEDQPATEVHDDLEVRAMFVRGELGAVCLLVCDLLGMSPSFARPVRESVAAALGLELGAVLTSCVHTHAGPSTIAGSEALGWVTPEGYRELLVERCTAAGASGRGHRGSRLAPRREVPAARRAVDQPARPAVRADVRGARRHRARRLARRHARQRRDPPGRARAGVPGRVERLGRPVPHGAPSACGRVDGAAVRRARRRQPAPRPPPGQRLPRRRLRRGRPARPRRRRGRRRGAARRGARRDDGPDGRAGAHPRRDHGRDAAHVRAGGAAACRSSSSSGRSVRCASCRCPARRSTPSGVRSSAADRTCSSPASRPSGTATSRCRSRTATRSR